MKTTTISKFLNFQNLSSFLLLSLILGCAADVTPKDKPKEPGFGVSSNPDSIVVMTYNVENLFDTVDDENRNDETYLPIELKQSDEHKETCKANNNNQNYLKQCLEFDWSEERLSIKLKRLAEVILSVNDGQGPDVLIVEEVENINALNLLNNALAGSAYPTVVLIEGPDVRGIDIGMLSRFPLESAELHAIPVVEYGIANRPTRSILQSDFKLPSGELFTAFGVHFPSPSHKNSERALAFSVLKEAYHHLPENRMVVAGGDFNITSENDDKTNIVDFEMNRDFMASHKVGCADCNGSSYYGRAKPKYQWSFLDIIFTSKNMAPGKTSVPYTLNVKSIDVANYVDFQKDDKGLPQRFLSWDWDEPRGISDHWPIVLTLDKK